ncbi:fructosamine kinase family protein [Nocardioides carbamazepini]|uniref:fructosamine kinase family protein n=1 Tax=Nocardioides carbamazepini TaxID=2854259 RepID=UPI00214A7DA3|nr:fructosamine kinase family protein [Nocardioides carbamazepini]MCR1785099.1 fructosamine kinase family protein [Nocardioides carbamazepini]
MARQPVVAGRAEQLLGSAVVATAPVAGGDIATAVKLRLSSGRTAFLKTLSPAPPQFFAREAAGLRWLAEATPGGGVAAAEVLAVDTDCLILDWVETARPNAEAAATFGRALAATHAYGAPCFGLEVDGPGGSAGGGAPRVERKKSGGSAGGGAPRVDGYIGRLPLPNRPLPSWAEFHAERRIAPYLKVLRDKDIVSAEDAATIETAAARGPSIVPVEPPARLHGDLWNGNVLWAAGDRVVVIDPAAYGGHREVDLAMLALFGLPQLPHVMAAYHEATPLADGWEERLGYHQLFPLLVHACLFGGQYGARAARVAQRYL